MGMVDLHCHLLPGIDDGAQDVTTAVSLAKIAVESGTTHMVCTPHIHPGRYDNTSEIINTALAHFSEAISAAGIELKVAAAAEVRFGMELMAGISQGVIPFLGSWEGKRVLLLEFPHGEIPFGAEKLTRWLLDKNIIPMIAHPERNKAIMRSPSKLKPFIQQGCLTQVTAQSVAGGFGEPARQIAIELLDGGLVTILASDGHNVDHRPPSLLEGLRAAESIVGHENAAKLVSEVPWKIASGHFD